MLNGILWFCIAINLAACAYSTYWAFKHRKWAKQNHEEFFEHYLLVLGKKRELFKQLGAYPAEKEGYMYIDLPGGLRLVIFEGKIDGWYFGE